MLFFNFLKTKNTYSDIEFQYAYLYIFGFLMLVFLFKLIFSRYPSESTSRLKTKLSKPKSLKNADQVLKKYSHYYKNLVPELQNKFVRRLEIFIDLKEIITRKTEQNTTINLLIGAAAVQLTFGLKDFRLYSFNRIVVYPTSYYNNIRKVYHKGEINVKQRLIILSAEHFLFGIRIKDDGLNLGLHEMAHALNVEAFEEQHNEFKFFFREWEEFAVVEMKNIKQNDNHFLRKYAATNIQEMFAVCTEYFFEKPEEFDKKLPKLYKALCNVYKQDPKNATRPIKE